MLLWTDVAVEKWITVKRRVGCLLPAGTGTLNRDGGPRRERPARGWAQYEVIPPADRVAAAWSRSDPAGRCAPADQLAGYPAPQIAASIGNRHAEALGVYLQPGH